MVRAGKGGGGKGKSWFSAFCLKKRIRNTVKTTTDATYLCVRGEIIVKQIVNIILVDIHCASNVMNIERKKML